MMTDTGCRHFSAAYRQFSRFSCHRFSSISRRLPQRRVALSIAHRCQPFPGVCSRAAKDGAVAARLFTRRFDDLPGSIADSHYRVFQRPLITAFITRAVSHDKTGTFGIGDVARTRGRGTVASPRNATIFSAHRDK